MILSSFDRAVLVRRRGSQRLDEVRCILLGVHNLKFIDVEVDSFEPRLVVVRSEWAGRGFLRGTAPTQQGSGSDDCRTHVDG